MAGRIILDDGNRLLDTNGDPISGGLLRIFTAGTTTPATLFTTINLNVSHPNPIVADAGGFIGQLWSAGDQSYDIRYYAADDTAFATPLREFLNLTSFAQSSNFSSGGTGAASRNVSVKLSELPVTTGDYSTIQQALDAAGIGGAFLVDDDVNVGSTAPLDPGVDFEGEKGIYYEGASGGRRLLNKPGRDSSLMQFGRENLVRWLEGLRDRATMRIALVGDSNTEGRVGPVLQGYLGGLTNITTQNFGVSGTQVEQWRTASSPYDSNSKSLADVIAFDPDLIVMCWGTNDPAVGARDADDFTASMDAALTTLRASLPAQECSIALLTPNAMGYTLGRDELWSLQIRSITRAMADRFDCAYFDKNALFPNSAIDLEAGPKQNTWLDEFRVHPKDLQINILAAMIAEWLVPRELWSMVWENISQKIDANPPEFYPPGVSITRMQDSYIDGFVATLNPINTAGHFCIQLNWGFSGADFRLAWRISTGSVFGAWQSVGGTKLNVVPASGFSLPPSARMRGVESGGLVATEGYVQMDTPASLTSAQTIATLAVGTRPDTARWNVPLWLFESTGGTWEEVPARINSDGTIVTMAASTMSPERVYLQASWPI